MWFPVGRMTSEIPVTATATFCATIVDQWVQMGLTDSFVAPGSRSTPLALALVNDARVATHVFHDERSASFACLGHGLTTGRPAILLCTSGTAATHFHGAVVEADASDVPMLVCTADRPPELWGVGAPQTINQTNLYGDAVRLFVEPGPQDEALVDPETWRPMAGSAWNAATGTGNRSGPVHLNLSFRDPLVGKPSLLPDPIETIAADSESPTAPDALTGKLSQSLNGRSGVVVAGRFAGNPADVWLLADRLGWPVLADHRSGCRTPGRAIRHFDTLLRSEEFAESQRPDVILRIGEPLASKSLSQWITACAVSGTSVIALTDGGKTIDPERVASSTISVERALPAVIDLVPDSPVPSAMSESWTDADRTVETRVDEFLDSLTDLTEPAVARTVLASVPIGGALMVSSSMPVRDVEWFGPNRDDIAVYANRGANGIDGVTSTAIGIALTGLPTTCLIGDIAFLHDNNGLISLMSRPIDLTIVVVDNDGGGIFSFLPQHELLATDDYEQLFGTPHGVDLSTICSAHAIPVERWSGALNAPDGVRVVIASTDRSSGLAVRASLADLAPVQGHP